MVATTATPDHLSRAQARSIDTVIFVDVDGVLNIGAQDTDAAPLLLNKTNVNIAMQDWSEKQVDVSEHLVAIEKLRSVAQRHLGHGDDCTYTKFMCSATWSISEELAKRLADIIRTAGDRAAVVLSSNWRKAQHAPKVRKLEYVIAKHLGEPFAFDAMTAKGNECKAWDRLELVGNFLSELSSQRTGLNRPLQALVLDDFFITEMTGWSVGDIKVESVEDAEVYLNGRASAGSPVSSRVVHCFDKWYAPSGLEIRVGGGLTMQRVDEAMAFLLSTQDELEEQANQENEEEDYQSAPIAKVPSEPAPAMGILQSKKLLSKSCGTMDDLLHQAYIIEGDALKWIESA